MQASVVNVYYYMRMISALTCTDKHAAYSLYCRPARLPYLRRPDPIRCRLFAIIVLKP